MPGFGKYLAKRKVEPVLVFRRETQDTRRSTTREAATVA